MSKIGKYLWPRSVFEFYRTNGIFKACFGFVGKNGIEEVEKRTFDSLEMMTQWYREIKKTYPATYGAAMVDVAQQGAFPGCKGDAYEKFRIDTALLQSRCIDGKWTVFIPFAELKWFEQRYKEIELDFLFSPFVLLYLKARGALSAQLTMYILHFHGHAYTMVMNDDRVRFAHVINISGDRIDENIEMDEEEEDLSFDLDMLDEEMGVEEIEEMEGMEAFEELAASETGSDEQESDQLKALEYHLEFFERIKEALNLFYRDRRYESDFVEKVVVYDTDDLVDDLVRYVNDELFMEASVEKFELFETISKAVCEELGC